MAGMNNPDQSLPPSPSQAPERSARYHRAARIPPRLLAVVRDNFPGRTYTGLRAEIFELAAAGGNVLMLESYGVLSAAEKAALRACARAVAEWRGEGCRESRGEEAR